MDKSPSFGVIVSDEGKSSFSCYGCKQKGTIRSLVYHLGRYRGVSYQELAAEVTALEGSSMVVRDFDDAPVERPRPEPLEEAIWDGLFEDPYFDPAPRAFMERRRVSEATCQKLGLGFDPEAARITFPVRGAGGELYGFSGRSILDNARIKVKDYAGLPKLWLVLGRERWTPGKRVLIVEGLFAYARMHEIGAEAHFNVGALLGSEMTPEKAEEIAAFGHGVILLLDPDQAGDDGTFGRWDIAEERQRFEESAIARLMSEVPVYVPEFPEGVSDVDDLTLDQLLGMIQSCKPFQPSPEQRRALERPKRPVR